MIKKLDKFDWEVKYQPFINEEDNQLLSLNDFGGYKKFIEDYGKNHIWTLIQGDDGKPYIITGCHAVNALEIILTKVGWKKENEVEVPLTTWWY